VIYAGEGSLERLLLAGKVATMEETTNSFRVLVGKPLGRTKEGLWDSINMDLMEIGGEARRRMKLAQESIQWRLVLAVLKLRVI
jgi:hypothetical protein